MHHRLTEDAQSIFSCILEILAPCLMRNRSVAPVYEAGTGDSSGNTVDDSAKIREQKLAENELLQKLNEMEYTSTKSQSSVDSTE